ncbi:retinal-specific phospholipid-transporting ATPase ABCA4-like isoform X2 [Belonocnema kinseyi]|nr:retinal-specific phospholipid-transporting ATPase ABCA4-like isoform X2 [Belonocnema kinseyi]
MANKLRVFSLLMWKNYTVRKRHWKVSLLVEICIPLLLFILTQVIRDFAVENSSYVKIETNDTYYPIQTKDEVLSFMNDIKTFVYFVPKNNFTKDIMQTTRRCLSLPESRVIGFSSEDELLKNYTSKKLADIDAEVLGVIFKNPDELNSTSKRLDYTIRSDGRSINAFLDFVKKKPFLQIQMCLDESFLTLKMSNSNFNSQISIQQMPDPAQTVNLVQEFIRPMYAVVAVMAFLIPLYIEAAYPANEKNIGVNVLISMNGVKNYENLLSWLMSGLFFSILYILPRLILFKISFSQATPYLYFGNIFLVGVMHYVHIVHLLAFGYHIASYFSKSTFRALAIEFIYLGSFAMQNYFIKSKIYAIIPYFGIFFPNILLYRIYEEIDIYEEQYIGVGFDNLFLVGDLRYANAGSLGVILIFSILGTVLHFLLALYVSSLFPGKFGVAKHPLDFLKILKSKKVSSEEELYDCNYNNMEGKPFEAIPKDVFTPGIQIRNLKKSYVMNVFSGEATQALRGISLDFYKGQITTLLGHNGAGKTTMMSILTGLLSPTEGIVLINGKRVTDQMDEIVTDLGLCPQEDILFPDLNVFEQIEFFGLLKNKNKTRAQVKKNVNDLLKQLKLTAKRNVLPAKLSGGQKRRTCLGMAIIGDASTLILDEPTSGMDPETRREAWDILLKMRGEKTILISTHNMEEADVLGDRTAIVQLGELKSYGTPMFLKKFYGQGNIEVTLSTEDKYDLEKIRNQFTGESELINFDGGKIVLSIPYTDHLPDDLDKIESSKKKLGVNGISVSLITLEQVFLKATNEDNDKTEVDNSHMERIKKVDGHKLVFQSAMALLLKKLTFTQKNMLTFLFMLLLPLLGILFIALGSIDLDDTNVHPTRLDMYRDPITFYFSNDDHCGQIYDSTVKSFNGKVTRIKDSNISEALLNFSRNDLGHYKNNLVAAATFELDKYQKMEANALFSQKIFYSIPISFNLLSNTIIKALVGEDYQIDLSTQQMPNPYHFRDVAVTDGKEYFDTILFMSFLIPTLAMYVIHPLRESYSGIKNLQRMTGVTSYLYWGTFFIFDFLFFIISLILMLIGFYCMDVILDLRLFYGTEMSIMFLLLTLFAVSTLPFVYIFTFLKRKTSTVISILAILPLVFVLLESIINGVIHIAVGDKSIAEILSVIEKRIFMLLPSVSFFYGQVSFFVTANKNAHCRKMPEYLLKLACEEMNPCCSLNCSDGKCEKHFEYFGNFEKNGDLEECALYLFLTPFLYFTILLLLEQKIVPLALYKYSKKNPDGNNQEMDEQVMNEKTSVAAEIEKLIKQENSIQMQSRLENASGDYSAVNTLAENDSIYLVYKLSKNYGNLTAVKEISFSVKKSECFGLLGVNGAGKSTTFRMLTGEEVPNSGVMYLNGKEITSNRKEYLAQMGYCPQNSALIKTLNSRDHLKLFACLRGVPNNQVSSEVQKWINRLNLNLCALQPCGTYSGGNKRRLSIAIALIGNPNLVLLDEPTTGVDPAARRSLWHVIKSCQLAGQSIILTSHSMEECEVLCNRLVIMVRGQLVCIGPSEQLKQRFGAGYDINLKLHPDRSNIDIVNMKNDIEKALECELRDEHVGYLTYHVTNATTKWKTMYGVMKNLQEKYSCIEDFSVLSATLEQLFLQFARADENKMPTSEERNLIISLVNSEPGAQL